MLVIVQIADFLLMVLTWVIIVQAVLSWLVAFNVINLHNPGVRGLWQGLDRLLEPLYRPFRRIMPDFGGLDLSPMVVILIIYIIRQFILPAIGTAVIQAGL